MNNMLTVVGKHSIQSAAKNPYRKNIIFSGTMVMYKELGLQCKFVESKRNVLFVNELFVAENLENEPKIVLLDSIEDVGNVGSLIRSASGMGYAVLLRNCPMNEKIIEIACGGIDNTKINILKNSNQLKQFANTHFIYGLDTNGTPMFNCQKHSPHILVVGSEQNGIYPSIRSQCHEIVSLCGGVLNASIAGAIAMYCFTPI